MLTYKSNRKEYIAVIDASFMEKNSKKTEGLSKFYNGKTGRSEHGLEMLLVSIINIPTTIENTQKLSENSQKQENMRESTFSGTVQVS